MAGKTFFDHVICDLSRRGGQYIGSRAWGAKVKESTDWDYIVPESKAKNLIDTVYRWSKQPGSPVCNVEHDQEEGIPSVRLVISEAGDFMHSIHIRILPDDIFVAWFHASSMMHGFPSIEYSTREARLFMFKQLVNFFRFWKTNA